jgi:hypothetical protein
MSFVLSAKFPHLNLSGLKDCIESYMIGSGQTADNMVRLCPEAQMILAACDVICHEDRTRRCLTPRIANQLLRAIGIGSGLRFVEPGMSAEGTHDCTWVYTDSTGEITGYTN